MRTIREEEPPKPSTRLRTLAKEELSAVADQRGAEPAKLGRAVRGDLDWIVMKALEKDRSRRYETATGLARDIERHLTHELVVACPPSSLYRFQKLVRRNKLAFAAVGAVATALLLGLGLSTWLFFREKQALQRAMAAEQEQVRLRQQAQANEQKAQTEAAKSQQVSRFLQDTLRNVASVTFRDRAILGNILDLTANRVGNELKNQPEVEAELRTALGQTYMSLRRATEAEAMHREALAIQKRLFGKEHPSVANSLEAVADVLSFQGKHTEAEMLSRQAIAMGKKLLGNEHPNVANSLDELAMVLLRQSQRALGPLKERQLTEAEDLERETLAIRRKLFGNEHLDIARSLEGLGMVLLARGNTAEAERRLREALAMRQKLLGGDNLLVAMSLLNLADALSDEGEYAEADPLFREALAIRRKLVGNEHPDVAYALGHLADLLQKEGKLAEAEDANREAVAINRKVLGNEHPYTAGTISTLANVLQRQGKLAEAETLYREALALTRRLWGNEHLYTVGTLRPLADVVQRQGKLAEAEALRREALAITRQLWGNNNPRVIGPRLYRWARVLRAEGKLDEATLVYGELLTIRRKAAESGDVQALNSLAWLLATCPDEKIRDGRSAVNFGQKAVAATNRKTAPYLDALAAAYAEAGQFKEAVQVEKEAMSLVNADKAKRDYEPRLKLYESNSPYHDRD